MIALSLLLGLGLLVLGAHALVRGASQLAAAVGVPSLIVGLTVVAFGTSAPELAVSVKAAWSGQADVGLGNVIGSNIFNVLCILGISALLAPLTAHHQLVRLDVPLMIGLSILTWGLAYDGFLGWVDGLLLLCGLALYTSYLIYRTKTQDPPLEQAAASGSSWPLNLALVGAGLLLLMLGSHSFVSGAVSLAKALGVSELVIGLTIVSVGTSLPEAITSIVAAFRGERDIAVGNVIGSNLFNLMGVLGASALIAPGGMKVMPALLHFDLPVMIAASLICLPIFFTEGMISRREGGLLLICYIAYTAYLLLAATRHSAQPWLGGAMLYVVCPLAALVLGISTWRELQRRSRS